MNPKRLLLSSFLSLLVATAASRAATVTVAVDKPGAAINPAMWGVFFEDINFGADGGLYGELVKNRSFEFPRPFMGWTALEAANAITIRDEAPFNAANPHYLRIEAADGQTSGVVNEGFRGIGVRAGATYRFTTYARSGQG